MLDPTHMCTQYKQRGGSISIDMTKIFRLFSTIFTVNETFIDLTQPDSHTTAERLQATADTVIVISSDDDKGTELQGKLALY